MIASKPHQFIHSSLIRINNSKNNVVLFVDNFSGYLFAPLITQKLTLIDLTNHIVDILKSIDMEAKPEFILDYQEDWINMLNEYFFDDANFQFNIIESQKITTPASKKFLYSFKIWQQNEIKS